jgi:hypothetical protein
MLYFESTKIKKSAIRLLISIALLVMHVELILPAWKSSTISIFNNLNNPKLTANPDYRTNPIGCPA